MRNLHLIFSGHDVSGGTLQLPAGPRGQALGEESRSHQDILSSCQAVLSHSPQLIRGALAATYHLLLGQAPPLPSLVQPPRTPPVEEQTSSAAPPILMPKQSLRPKR